MSYIRWMCGNTNWKCPRSAACGKRVCRVAAAISTAALILLVGLWGVRRIGSIAIDTERPSSEERLGVEVKRLRVLGREVDARVFELTAAGTIVVAPCEAVPQADSWDGRERVK